MRRLIAASVAALLLSAPAAAQRRDTIISRTGLPRDVAREASRLFNETAALRSTERLDIDIVL